ncbi:DUF6270 domain-containing protein [Rhizobium sp. YS-1r]|uniref:DUF6270 domain-containing protein n=1 Tax=Rhizobium sp. YS-1r TaxID=1532558 RepID=UPI0005101322|nr:DUF6270 domain-containing protein [Rhizobium sp. YS-1r]KGD99379.1 hypothetical protein JL39_13675 [Rhizobium sp. YS-1r]
MSTIAYYGSCPSEEFVKYAFPESNLAFFCYGINAASFMDDSKIELEGIEKWPEPVRKKMLFEAKRGFRERLRNANPHTLVIDFTRASRASLLRFKNSLLTVPYELLEAGAEAQRQAFTLFEIIPFGSREFWTLVTDSLMEFCRFMSRELPKTEVIFLDVPPASEYRGVIVDSDTYAMDFCRWQIRYPICRMLIDFCRPRIENSRILMPFITPFSDDAAAYGPAPMHYSPQVWQETARLFHANGGFAGLARSSDPVVTLTSYSGLMNAFTRTASSSRPDLRRFGLDILHGALPFLFAKIRGPADRYFRDPIDSQDVVAAFRWILGREPESAMTFLNHYALADRRELRNTLLRSTEFQNQVKHYAQT